MTDPQHQNPGPMNEKASRCVEIPLVGSVGAGMVALVDREDIEVVGTIRWWASKQRNASRDLFYAAGCTTGRRLILMHRFILDLPKGEMIVDHINGNGLDNRRENLRVCTQSQNLANQRVRQNKTKSSRFRGVTLLRQSGKWQAQIQVNGRQMTLGVFTSEEDAAEAFDRVAREHFGSYARFNFPQTNERDVRDEVSQ